MGTALWSPGSEISLRFVSRQLGTRLDLAWWRERIGAAIARRGGLLDGETNACRYVHGEGDGLPSLVVDRFDRWLVVQLLSAGLEAYRAEIVEALVQLVQPEGILARNDGSFVRVSASSWRTARYTSPIPPRPTSSSSR